MIFQYDIIITFHANVSHLYWPMSVFLNRSVRTIPGCTEYVCTINDLAFISCCSIIVNMVCANLLCPYDRYEEYKSLAKKEMIIILKKRNHNYLSY